MLVQIGAECRDRTCHIETRAPVDEIDEAVTNVRTGRVREGRARTAARGGAVAVNERGPTGCAVDAGLDRGRGTAVAPYGVVVAVVPGSVAASETQGASDVARGRNEVMNLISRLRRLLRKDSGQDLLEYALLAALIALVAVVAVTTTGTEVNSVFGRVTTQLQSTP